MGKNNKPLGSKKKAALVDTEQQTPATTEQQTSSDIKKQNLIFLEFVKLTNFGAFTNRVVGPFKPGLNVIYGPNEAGKTTVNQLVRGVLFGWPRHRANTNSYKPESSERAGSLFFTNKETRETVELKRTKNSDELEDEYGVLADIDADTYNTMFSLTSDELLNLRSHDEVTAHLLTAGSGTGVSPAQALAQIDEEIQALMSKSAQKPQSLPNLRASESQLKERVRLGVKQAESYLSEQQQLEELIPRMDSLAENQEELNEEIQRIRETKTQINSLDAEIAEAKKSLEEAISAEHELKEDLANPEPEDLQYLAELSEVEMFRLKEGLAEHQASLDRAQHAFDIAKKNESASRLAYEALASDPDFTKERQGAARQRKVKLVLSVIVPLIMFALCAWFILRVMTKPNISLLAGSAAVFIGALFIFVAGFVTNFRPSRVEDEMADRLKKAEWVKRQDALMLEECQRELDSQQAKAETYLSAHHLSGAAGSIKRAYEVINQAQKANQDKALQSQSCKALALQIQALKEEIGLKNKQRAELCRTYSFPSNATPERFDSLIERLILDRKRVISVSQETSQRVGELKEKLHFALGSWDFDADKLELNRVRANLKEAERQLTTLLVARLSLKRAIADWEKVSQPEVYRLASELFELMTDGAWRKVFMNSNGEIRVMDALHTIEKPEHLSTGTRQQLYLSLRIALLLTADSVGKYLPVMCDDILVNFDEERRMGAARALARLAQHRQVLLFTCHPEVIKLFSSVEPSANYIEL